MRQLQIVTRVMKLDDMGVEAVEESTTLRINTGLKQGSKTGEMDSSTQSRVGVFAHPTCLLYAY
jgi:hypothetical protein